MTKEEIRSLGKNLGIDLVGFTTCDRLEQKLPESVRPSQISEYLPVFMVLAKHIPVGISAAADGSAKQMAAALVHRVLEQEAAELAYGLEERDYLAVVLPSLMMDFKGRDELSNTPAGQGSLYIRLAAVEAGLGTMGLNNMLLTREFGPRVYLCGMMTNIEVKPDEPLEDELCLGLEDCGRCASVCPGDAIPRQSLRGAPLAEYRDLDGRACAEYSQPHGVGHSVDHFRSIFQQKDTAGIKAKIDSADTSLLWYHMAILRQGAFTGCSKCLQVCPIGNDYESIQTSPHRQRDLPVGVRSQISGEKVSILLSDPAAGRGHKTDGVSKGEKR